MELTFVAAGPGVRLSRLAPANADPAEGAFGSVPTPAGTPEKPERISADGWRAASPVTKQGAVPTAARGVDHGSLREDYRRSAAVALARPSVRQGRASIATARRGRPSDTLDSSEEVASAVQSLITASSAGGLEGSGPGGTSGGGAPGSAGASGPGSRARPSGEGGAEDPSSALGIRSYAAALTRKVYPYWEDALPLWARAEGRGGMAVIGVTLGENGSVRDVHLVRGSGIPEFDRKVASALERASPYGPLPRAIRSGGLQLHIAFDAMNPAVGRAGPGPGRR
jgi:TonB family protein